MGDLFTLPNVRAVLIAAALRSYRQALADCRSRASTSLSSARCSEGMDRHDAAANRLRRPV